jgi:signal peptidase II
LDRWTKIFFESHPPLRIVSGILETTVHRNYGLIANAPLPMPLIIVVTAAASALFAVLLWRSAKMQEGIATIGLAFILAGALGNLYDRIAQGYVFDWILLFGRSVVNLADAWVAIGAIVASAGSRARGLTPKEEPT